MCWHRLDPAGGLVLGAACIILSLLIQAMTLFRDLARRQPTPDINGQENDSTSQLPSPQSPDPLLIEMPAMLQAWLRQLDVVADLVKHNIEALLAPFTQLMGRLQEENQTSATLFGSPSSGHSITDVLQETNARLASVIAAFDGARSYKLQLQRTITDLSGFMLELKSMASAVQKLASQTNLLALNAAIEAARAARSDARWRP